MKQLIETLTQYREVAPSEPPHFAKLRKEKPSPVFNGYARVRPKAGTSHACDFYHRRNKTIADLLERAGFQKVTIQHGGLTMTVWNTKETFDIIIKNAKRK